MRAAIAGFVIGVAWLQFQVALPEHLILLLSFAGALLVGSLSRWQRLSKFSSALRIICGMLLGVLWASLFALHYLKHELPKDWEGRDITLIGTIDSMAYRFERGVRFNFAVEHALDGEAEVIGVPSKLALSWHAGFGTESSQPVPDVKPGERWQLIVRLKRPHGNANPHGFDYEACLLEQNVRASGCVRPEDKSQNMNHRVDEFVFSFGNVVERSRAWLPERILATVPDRPYAGVLVALVVGDQRAIRQSDWSVFNRTSVGHLFSISGLHVTMIAGMAAAMMFGLWRRVFVDAVFPAWGQAESRAVSGWLPQPLQPSETRCIRALWRPRHQKDAYG